MSMRVNAPQVQKDGTSTSKKDTEKLFAQAKTNF